MCQEGAGVEVGGAGEGGFSSLVQRDNYSLQTAEQELEG